ncbi:MAG: hypothetical protein ACRD4D_05600 [Candidatus Acidiferrales bacterium]
MKTVLVVGRGWRFRSLLRAQLFEEGFDARGFESLEQAAGKMAETPPPAVVFDTAEAASAELAQLPALSVRLPLLVVASAGESLPLSDACVLHRPLQISQLIEALKNRLHRVQPP